MASRILLVEDDATIGTVLTSSLHGHGYDVTWERTGACALARATTNAIDLVLLDLGLPDLEGTEVCRRLRRAQPGCVIVILTARSAEMDVVVDSGADDYLVKPVRLAELQARLRAHLRRNEAGATAPEVRRLGDLVIDARRRRVTVAGQELHLRPKEFDLLDRLAAEPDVALRRETLMSDVWDAHWFGSTKTLDVHIRWLRQKLGDAPDAPRYLHTVRGVGFRFNHD